ADVPGDEPVAVMSFDSWLRERTAPWARDEACFLAVTDRDDVVGFADIEQWELPGDVAWHGYTAVRAAWRGRGLAGALKLQTIAWARAAGVRELRTENEASNAAMRHINARLGYVPIAVRADWRGPVAAFLP
ncbi:MAG: GCN5-related N-acetyltransferase, partial [Thermoleophilia bacterium]|nr:GCN5-related N-acetyltransferase [Thermoleophilia bacterium]